MIVSFLKVIVSTVICHGDAALHHNSALVMSVMIVFLLILCLYIDQTDKATATFVVGPWKECKFATVEHAVGCASASVGCAKA